MEMSEAADEAAVPVAEKLEGTPKDKPKKTATDGAGAASGSYGTPAGPRGYELIIAEKPQAAIKIAYALAEGKPIQKAVTGVKWFEITRHGKKIIIASTVGHIFSLTEKEKGPWTYPIFDLAWKPAFEVSKTASFTRKYFATLKRLAAGASSFANACDLDTEGELIFRNILRFICNKEDATRMRFSTLTRGDLIDAYENAAPHLDFGMAAAGETRHWLDFLWGVNTSRALTLAIKAAERGFKVLSSGRVQSPTLALLAKREGEIEKFVPVPYWQLLATLLIKNQEIKAAHEKEKFWNEEEAKDARGRALGKQAIVASVKRREYKVQPPVPFNLTSLQTAAYEAFGFSPSLTLQIAESLYLAAYISYPRTASEKLPAKIGWTQILRALEKFPEFKATAGALLSKSKLRPHEGKKTDPAHVAVYPTQSAPEALYSLDEKQRKLYELIARRFLACFEDAAIRESLKISFDIGGELFVAEGGRTIKPGWTSVYGPFVRFREVILPTIKENESYDVGAIDLSSDATKPPARFSQGSIVAEMEKRGLGTKATRAEILQTLYDRNYITDRQIKVTELGRQIVRTLEKHVPDLVSEKLTRHFEKETESVQFGKKKEGEVVEEAKKILSKILKKFKKKELVIGKELADALAATRRIADIVGKCPACDSDLKIIRSKATGKVFVGCSGYPKCQNSFPLPQKGLIKTTNQVCKACNSPIVLVITKGRRPWVLCINPKCPTKAQNQNQNAQDKNQDQTPPSAPKA